MSDATPLAHTAFMATMQHFIHNGATQNERELARMLRDIYLRTCENPRVVNYINEWTFKVLS